eukprot:scaffold34720_cov67-Cyclotella_meneghiniana.AAC.1
MHGSGLLIVAVSIKRSSVKRAYIDKARWEYRYSVNLRDQRSEIINHQQRDQQSKSTVSNNIYLSVARKTQP